MNNFTITAYNLTDKNKKIELLSEFSLLKDNDIKYSAFGDEKKYFNLIREIHKNPVLINMMRIQSSDESLLRRYNCIYFNRYKSTDGSSQSQFIQPLDFVSNKQFQGSIIDIPMSYSVDINTDISYVIKPHSGITFGFFIEPFGINRKQEDKIHYNKSHVSGVPVWITNESNTVKEFKLYTRDSDYEKEELNNGLDVFFWGEKKEVLDCVKYFLDNDKKNISLKRLFTNNNEQLKQIIVLNSGEGNESAIVPCNLISNDQFQADIVDFNERDKFKIKNLFHNKEHKEKSYIKMNILPKTSVCIWIETF